MLETSEVEKLIESGSPICWVRVLITVILYNGEPTISSSICTSQAVSELLCSCDFLLALFLFIICLFFFLGGVGVWGVLCVVLFALF